MKSITYQRNGSTITIPLGFSWTTFFFSWIPSAYRSHWRLVWIIFLSDILATFLTVFVFEGKDALLSPIALRLIVSHFRNKELHIDAQLDGWRLPQIVPFNPVATND